MQASIVGLGFGMNFTKVIAATDITYVVEYTTDLVTWNAIPQNGAAILVAPDGLTATVTVTSPQSLATEPGQFLRLRITRP